MLLDLPSEDHRLSCASDTLETWTWWLNKRLTMPAFEVATRLGVGAERRRER